MYDDDDYGFWDDSRARSHSVPITRPLGPRSVHATVDLGDPGFAPSRPANYFWRRLGALLSVGIIAAPIALVMRGSDSGPWSRLCALPALWTGIYYDSQALAAAWDGLLTALAVDAVTQPAVPTPARRAWRFLDRVAAALVDIGKVEQDAKLDGRNMIMVLAPK